MNNEEDRRKAVDWALAMTRNTPISPDGYELQLLDQFVRGVLTIDQVLEQLEQRSPSSS